MELFAVPGIPEVRAGDDLAAMIAERADRLDRAERTERADRGESDGSDEGSGLRDGDVVCVASTVVSKAEGRTLDLDDVEAGERANEIAERIGALAGEEKDPRFAQVVLDESDDLIMDAPFLLAVTPFGHVTVNAGIDRSNVPDHDLLLLPEDPSASAERIRDGLDVDAPVVVTDTCGRPFRHGQRGVAIGWAGMPASRDWRGEHDRDGRELGVTVESVVDELAAASNLLSGEGAGGTPVVVVRDFEFGDHAGSDNLFRDRDGDFVRQALEDWRYEG